MNFQILKLIFVSLFLALLYSCNHTGIKVEEKYPDGKIKISYYLDTTHGKHDTLEKTVYYPNGKIRIKGTYEKNLRQGLWEYYHENGNLWSKGQFLNGQSNGIFYIYNEDGTIFMQSSYKKGIPDGLWTFYEKGKKTKDVTFKNDSMVKEINY
jgi:antitoxin component YwqK of YwqJK toxin-antitoxin module